MAAPRGSRERLVPGLSLHRGPDGLWRRFGPVDELLRITGPDAPVAAVAAWLAGGAGEDPGERVLGTARALGLLEADPRPGPKGTRATVLGAGPVAEELRSLLTRQGWQVGPEALEPGRTDVVVAVDDVQRDAVWTALDAQLVAAGVPWHRAFREGRRWVVGPFWTAPGDATYHDYRVRRLAADPQPDELEARLRAADEAPVRADASPGDDAFPTAVAARIACDLAAHRDGRRAPGRDVEALLDPVLGTIERHPVLALPPAPTP